MPAMKAKKPMYNWKRMASCHILNRRIMKYPEQGNTVRISAERKTWSIGRKTIVTYAAIKKS